MGFCGVTALAVDAERKGRMAWKCGNILFELSFPSS